MDSAAELFSAVEAALNDHRIDDDRVDVQLPFQLFGLHGHVAIQPQQIKPNNAPHSPFHSKSREHEPVNSPCQIRELAA